MNELHYSIWNILSGRLDHLSLKCSGCEKILECEEHPTQYGTSDFEPRYCKTLIMAAILEDDTKFVIPFPKGE